MSIYKSLLAQDIKVIPFTVNKGWNFQGTASLTASNVSIDGFIGTPFEGNFNTSLPTTGRINTRYQYLVYNSIKQLYFSNFISSSLGGTASYGDSINRGYVVPGFDSSGDIFVGSLNSNGRFENYSQTSLSFTKFFPTSSFIGVISIPSSLYGNYIVPHSFRISSNITASNTTTATGSFILTDDGEGNIFITGSSGRFYYGNIFYSHGIIVLTNSASYAYGCNGGDVVEIGYGGIGASSSYGTASYGAISSNFILPAAYHFTTSSTNDITCSFSSSLTIFETQYKCTIRENEFNYSINPSIISSSRTGVPYDFATGSFFDPYITTIGLYNDDRELLAVAKLPQPLKASSTTDTTIFINIDK